MFTVAVVTGKTLEAVMKNHDEYSDIKKTLLALAVIFALFLLFSPDAAAASDKQKHALLSAAMGGAAVLYLEEKTEHPVAYAVTAALVPGIAKEIYDAAHPKTHNAEIGDLVADFVGAVAGAYAGHGLYIGVAERGQVEVGISVPF